MLHLSVPATASPSQRLLRLCRPLPQRSSSTFVRPTSLGRVGVSRRRKLRLWLLHANADGVPSGLLLIARGLLLPQDLRKHESTTHITHARWSKRAAHSTHQCVEPIAYCAEVHGSLLLQVPPLSGSRRRPFCLATMFCRRCQLLMADSSMLVRPSKAASQSTRIRKACPYCVASIVHATL
jgi:hypothetical protein